MIPDKDEGLILFKDGKYVALKFDLSDWGLFKQAIERAKRELKVSDGKTSSNSPV